MDDGVLPFVEEDAPNEKVKRTRGPRRSRTSIDPTLIIRVDSKWNPKRPGTRACDEFDLYRDGMTVGDFWDVGGRFNSLLNDQKKGYIRLEPAS